MIKKRKAIVFIHVHEGGGNNQLKGNYERHTGRDKGEKMTVISVIIWSCVLPGEIESHKICNDNSSFSAGIDKRTSGIDTDRCPVTV